MPERERILVVEDEAALLRLLERYLVKSGYEVETSGSGEEASRTFATRPAEFALVILDLGLPGLPGQKLLEELLQLNPDIRVIVCSGRPRGSVPIRPGFEKQVGFVHKPFLPETLGRAIGELLGRG